jgi:fibronectin type 3 domain-containing protein
MLFPSLYNITQNLFSKSIPSSYDIPTPVSTSFSLSSLYNITQNLFSRSISSSYGISTAPIQVTGVRAEFNPPEIITLYWNVIDPDSFDHYEVHRSTSSGFSPSASTLIGIASTSSNSFVNRDLEINTSYYFKVCTVDKDGNKGTFSAQVTETTSGFS